MSTNDPQNPENVDNFARLLDNREQIADFVNSFTSERVQRQAFEAVVCSLGLAETNVADAPNVQRLRVVQQQPESEPDLPGDEPSAEAESTPRRRRGKNGARKNVTVPRGLNFAPEGHPSLEQFVAEKRPANLDEKNLVACYYLSNMMGMQDVGIGQILAAYQAAEWSAPAHPDTALRKTASSTGWIDTANSKSIKVVWKGENYLATKMPAQPKKTG